MQGWETAGLRSCPGDEIRRIRFWAKVEPLVAGGGVGVASGLEATDSRVLLNVDLPWEGQSPVATENLIYLRVVTQWK